MLDYIATGLSKLFTVRYLVAGLALVDGNPDMRQFANKMQAGPVDYRCQAPSVPKTTRQTIPDFRALVQTRTTHYSALRQYR